MNLTDMDQFPRGDMPGDKIEIEQQHLDKAKVIFPILKELLPKRKAVVCVCGGSGVGKSEIASVLAGMLCAEEIRTYVMSGDNYPHRIPAENDAHRKQVYEIGGRAALGEYLGSPQEIDFALVDSILSRFKYGIVSGKGMGK